jgi:hypothetical protein
VVFLGKWKIKLREYIKKIHKVSLCFDALTDNIFTKETTPKERNSRASTGQPTNVTGNNDFHIVTKSLLPKSEIMSRWTPASAHRTTRVTGTV